MKLAGECVVAYWLERGGFSGIPWVDFVPRDSVDPRVLRVSRYSTTCEFFVMNSIRAQSREPPVVNCLVEFSNGLLHLVT